MASIKYEAETQQHHPRVDYGIGVTVEGSDFEVHDWSLGGFSIEDAQNFTPCQDVTASLAFPFDGYELRLNAGAEVRYVRAGRTHFQFTDLDERKLNLLRFVIDSYIAGEIVRPNEVLEAAGRSAGLSGRDDPSARLRSHRVVRRIASTGALLLLIGGLAAFLWANIYEELYVVTAEAGVVSTKLVRLAAPAIGRISFLSDKKEVEIGEPLLTLDPAIGNPITVYSPCTCTQYRQLLSRGDFARTGETIVELARRDSPIVVVARVPNERLMSLYGVSSARITYADGQVVREAAILSLPGQAQGATNLPESQRISDLPGDAATVLLEPGREVSQEMVGQPVQVSFDLFDETALGRAWRRAANLANGILYNMSGRIAELLSIEWPVQIGPASPGRRQGSEGGGADASAESRPGPLSGRAENQLRSWPARACS